MQYPGTLGLLVFLDEKFIGENHETIMKKGLQFLKRERHKDYGSRFLLLNEVVRHNDRVNQLVL